MSPAEATSMKPYLVTMVKTSLKFLVSFSLFSILLPSTHIFTHALDKNYMFLLCNGILVFLATNSGLIGGGSSDAAGEHLVKYGTLRSPAQELPEKTEVVAAAEQEVAKGSVAVEDEDEDQGVEEEEEGTELMSADELNKKCDEFIMKMKQEIKSESQLVMVR